VRKMERAGVRWLVPLLLLLRVAAAAAQPRVLVLLEDLTIRNTHSAYFHALAQDGFSLEFKLATGKGLRLREWDDWLYDKLIVFAPSVAGAPSAPPGPRMGCCCTASHLPCRRVWLHRRVWE